MIPPRIAQWIPMGIAVGIALLVAALVTSRNTNGYHPVDVGAIEILSNGPFRPGDPVPYQNGVCNNSDDDLTMNIRVGVQEDVRDPLAVARTIELFARDMVPLPRGCVGREPSVRPLPTQITAGRWKVYTTLVIMGPQAGQIQRETVLSKAILVVQ